MGDGEMKGKYTLARYREKMRGGVCKHNEPG